MRRLFALPKYSAKKVAARQYRRKCRGWERLEPRQLLAVDAFDTGIDQYGLTGSYFSTDDLDPANLALVRTDSTINFDWGTGSPQLAMIPADNFSVRWSGSLTPEHSELYRFTVGGSSEAGIRLRVNGKVLIEAWTISRDFEYWTNVELTAGESAEIELEYRDTGNSSSIQLTWESPRTAKTSLPTHGLRPSQPVATRPGGLLEQWNQVPGPSLSDLNQLESYQANVPDLATEIRGADLPSEILDENGSQYFGQRFRSVLIAPETGNYTFRLHGDGTSELRLSNDGFASNAKTIAGLHLDSFSTKSDPIYLVAGESYYFETLRVADRTSEGLSITWTSPSSEFAETIPADVFVALSPVVRIHAVNSLIHESEEAITSQFIVSRTHDFGRALQVAYTLGGTALESIDYSAPNEWRSSGIVTIPAGQISTTIELKAFADELVETPESIIVRLAASPSLAYRLDSESLQETTALLFDVAPDTTTYSQADRQPLAVWRQDAWQSIKENRTLEHKIEVRDPNGNLIQGAVVTAELLSHAFPFSAEFDRNRIEALDASGDPTLDAIRYQAIADDLFTDLATSTASQVELDLEVENLQTIDQFITWLNRPNPEQSFAVDHFRLHDSQTDPQQVADLARDALIASFADVDVAGIYLDDIQSEQSLFDEDWAPNAFGQVWLDLVGDQWTTQRRGTTAVDGTYRFNGFAGSYRVTVEYQAQSKTVAIDLDEHSQVATLQIDGSIDHLRLTNVNQTVIVEDVPSDQVIFERSTVAGEAVQISTGTGSERIDVISLVHGIPTRLSTYGGDDSIYVASLEQIEIDGGTGYDRIVLSENEVNYDLDQIGGIGLKEIEEIDLTQFVGQFEIGTAAVAAISTTDKLRVIHRQTTDLVLGDQWTVEPMVWTDGRWYHQLTHNGIQLLVADQNAWRNPANPLDVDRSGEVTPLDALRVINRISYYPGPGLPRPLSDRELVKDYLDTNGDGRASALDALSIINWMTQNTESNYPGEQYLSPPQSTGQVATPVIADSKDTESDTRQGHHRRAEIATLF